MRAFSLITILIFLTFAYLQLNDTDPYLWFPLYFFVTVLASIRLFRPIPNAVLFGFIGLYLTLSIVFGLQVPHWDRDSEEIRETFGLLIAALFVWGLKQKSS